MSEFEWRDPPAARVGPPMWRDRIGELQANPGRWGRFGPFSKRSIHSQARQVRKRYGLEAVGRTEDGEGWLYARWVEEGAGESLRDA